jgi:hypothetical protein
MPATTCDVRVVAKYGISNPRGFHITPLPVALVPATATSAENAFTVKLDTVVAGSAVKQAASFVRFEAKRGQRVLAICRPFELDSRMGGDTVSRSKDEPERFPRGSEASAGRESRGAGALRCGE